MKQYIGYARHAVGLVVVTAAITLSVASSGTGTDPEGTCGPLVEDQGADGDMCEAREDCNEVCCLCDNGEFGFVAQGCNLDLQECYGGDDVCQLALADDPALCGEEDPGTDAGP
jgi:hypothetical protein